ncbi:MAG: flagellar export protein FliJ [Candidatus Krumholzibacteriia bacterium]
MAAFRFPLQKVLDHRARLVDLRARDLAAAESAAAGVAARIAERRSAQQRCQEAAGAGARLDVALLAARSAWIDRLDREIATLAQERQRALAAVAAARDALQAAWRDREVLAQLRERRYGQWRQAEARRDTRDLDEIGGQRRAREKRQTVAG